MVGLGWYKWYQNQTPGDVSVRRLNPEGGGHEAMCQQGRWALKGGGLGGPTLIREGNEYQRRRWASKGVDCEISHRLGRRTKHSL